MSSGKGRETQISVIFFRIEYVFPLVWRLCVKNYKHNSHADFCKHILREKKHTYQGMLVANFYVFRPSKLNKFNSHILSTNNPHFF